MDFENERRKLRLMQKFKVLDNGCWEWQCGKVYKSNGNYGMFYWGVVDGKEKSVAAHRAAWLLLRGPVPDDGILCHKCNYPTCVNPDHLYIGTHKTNAADRDAAGKTYKAEKQKRWKQTPELASAIIAAINTGKQLADVCTALGIGWQTLYRMRDRYPEIADTIKATKSARYSVGARKR